MSTHRLDIFRKTRSSFKQHRESLKEKEKVRYVLDKLGGREVMDGTSSIIKIERKIAKEYIYGSVPLAHFYSIDADLLSVLFPWSSRNRPGKLCLDDLLFFDIETTGLSGGAGTHIFLIGVLESHEGGFRLTQYFLHNLSSERLFLRCFRKHFLSHPVLVSYNGKSFDYNLIKTREVLNGLPPVENEPVHLDLLYSCRRMWKGMLSDFSLQSVERSALGKERPDDIPGYMIPEAYFRFLKGFGDPEETLGIFDHNLWDVLSLLALLIKMVSAVQWGIEKDERARRAGSVWCNHVSLSDMLLRNNYTEEALSLLKTGDQSGEVLKKLSLICKKEGLLKDAVYYFTTLMKNAERLSDYIFACTELAKIYEHRLKDLHKALYYTESARRRVERSEFLSGRSSWQFHNEGLALEKRLHRLKKRLSLQRNVSSASR